jgi:hypothetical protein
VARDRGRRRAACEPPDGDLPCADLTKRRSDEARLRS